MTEELDFSEEAEFIQRLRSGKVISPNIFTVEMGKLIKEARESKNLSQAKLAKLVNKRPATISDIENGKSEIGIYTLLLLCLELKKPISYFFPESMMKHAVMDINTPYQHEILELIREIEVVGDTKLTYMIIELLRDYYLNQMQE